MTLKMLKHMKLHIKKQNILQISCFFFFSLRTTYEETILQSLNLSSASFIPNYSYILSSTDAKDKIET